MKRKERNRVGRVTDIERARALLGAEGGLTDEQVAELVRQANVVERCVVDPPEAF